MTTASDPLVGSELGRFRIVRPIGEGGMGRVYEAVQFESGAVVAIKVIAERYASDPSLIERFFAEARAANLIAHEHIVKVHDLARLPDGRPYIVMERLAGQTLRALIDDAHPLPVGGVVHVVLEVLAALGAAHAAGIVHRDLKPDNIFVTAKGRAKVLDFGVAKLSGAHAIARTQTGIVLGTPEYMAPEHILDGAAEPRSDLYALGVVLFEALTGERPFRAGTDFDVMRAHVEREPPRPRALRPNLPAKLDDVIGCALAKDPRDRFASARAMANALRQIATRISIDEWRPVVPGGRLTSPKPPSEPPALELPSDAHAAQRDAGADTGATLADRPRPRASSPGPAHVRARRRRAAWAIAAGAVACAAAAGAAVAIRAGGDDAAAPGSAANGGAPTPSDARARTAASSDRRVVAEAPATPASPTEPTPPAPRQDRPARAPAPRPPSGPTPIEAREPARETASTSSDEGLASAPIDPARFDWRGFLPTARARVRERAADAWFSGLEITQVTPDGTVDLAAGARVTYEFSSSSLPEPGCRLQLEVAGSGTRLDEAEPGCGSPISSPRCTAAQVREKARVVKRASSDLIATLVLDAGGWTVRAPGIELQVVDDCTPGSWPSTATPRPIVRMLTERERAQFDHPEFARLALELARSLDAEAALVAIEERRDGDHPRRRYTYLAAGVCVAVAARREAVTVDRARCPARAKMVPIPRCAPAEIATRHAKRIPAGDTIVLRWEGTRWRVERAGELLFSVEDAC